MNGQTPPKLGAHTFQPLGTVRGPVSITVTQLPSLYEHGHSGASDIPATIFQRSVAVAIDSMIVGILQRALDAGIHAVWEASFMTTLLLINASLFAAILYYGLLQKRLGGRTPGKKLLKIRVVDLENPGQAPSPLLYLSREVVGKSLGIGFLGIGGLVAFTNPERRAFWDYLLKTKVVKDVE